MTLKVTDEQFIAEWKRTGGCSEAVARNLNLALRGVFSRRRRIEGRTGVPLLSSTYNSPDRVVKLPPWREVLDLKDGTIIIGSDAHIWPGPLTTAQRAFIQFARDLKPDVTILNGDLYDGALQSRFPHSRWAQEQRPSAKQELDACQAFMDALYSAHRPAKHIWTWGNHDARFESKLSNMPGLDSYQDIHGFHLKDHFPEWRLCMSVWVNDDVVIKHRQHNGIHAVYNNTLKGGKTMVTGHLHSLKVTPWTDYNGTRYGVDTGTLAELDSFQFDYCEDSPKNWRSGFAVLTFRDGKLLLPELVQVWDEGAVQFRGQLIPV